MLRHMGMPGRGLAAALLAVAACAGCSSEAPGTTFAIRPLSVDRPAYEQSVNTCRGLPGVDGGPVSESEPPMFSLAAAGDAVAELRKCLDGLKGVDVETIEGRPGEERGQAESIKRCADGSRVEAEPRYVGMTQSEFDAARPAGPIRVICKDRVFLDRTSDYNRDRLNLVIEKERIVWAGRF